MQLDDQYFMRKALEEAERAYEIDEVPVGAVIVVNQRIIARAHNLKSDSTMLLPMQKCKPSLLRLIF